jgi:hypothetical protein
MRFLLVSELALRQVNAVIFYWFCATFIVLMLEMFSEMAFVKHHLECT